MPDDLARIAVGLPVAALWPLAVPAIARHRTQTTALALLSAAYFLAPALPGVRAFLLLAITTACTFFLTDPEQRPAADFASTATWYRAQPAIGLLLGLLAAWAVDFDQARAAVENAVASNEAALVVAGMATCVFLGGSCVAWTLNPFVRSLRQNVEDPPSLDNAGRYIGWLERAILFAFVLAGEPEAAAIALAAKSFARFPSLAAHRGFTEYFLIGSLASLTVAIAVAAATRAAIGGGSF